jgi:peptidoglycan/xylan/chitin deacetylase (PgdA/CDA1 family)
MQILQACRLVLPMSEFVLRLQNRNLSPIAAAVTFDDGYLDNLTIAKPILDRYGVPATVFLTTGNVKSREAFWWDELSLLILGGTGDIDITTSANHRPLKIRLSKETEKLRGRSPWRAWDGRKWNAPRSERERAFLEVWKYLKGLGAADRSIAMEQLRHRLTPYDAPLPEELPMGCADAKLMANGPMTSIGAHSVSHSSLVGLTAKERREEVGGSLSDCIALSGRSVEGFAYPYGDCDLITKQIVREAGFKWACSTRSGGVDRNNFDVYDLPRIQIHNWPAHQLKRALISARPIF